MPEALELPSLTAAAARAASEDDIPTAAALLRQALQLQTSTLGPEHPDVATTLNNLALMLERLGHVKEAGQCYRRAHAIAAAALGPDDPVVQVSRANLDAFRATYAQPVESEDSRPVDPSVWGDLGDFPAAPAEPGPAAAAGVDRQTGAVPEGTSTADSTDGAMRPPWRTPALELAAEPGPEPGLAITAVLDREEELALAIAPPAAPPATPRRTHRSAPAPAPAPAPVPAPTPRKSSPAMGVLVVAAILIGAAWWWSGSQWFAPTGTPDASAPSAGTAPTAPGPAAGTPATAAAPAAPTPAPPASAPPTAEAPGARTTPPREIAASPGAAGGGARTPEASPTRAAVNGSLGVTVAQLCSTLSRSRNPWACQPAGSPVRSDAVYYYTRVRSTRDTSIRHRWTRDGRTVQDVRLQIRANATEGFRTFSRQTVSGLGAGTWVVALLGPDGAVLDEKTFEVR